jgi:hypothetical protein
MRKMSRLTNVVTKVASLVNNEHASITISKVLDVFCNLLASNVSQEIMVVEDLIPIVVVCYGLLSQLVVHSVVIFSLTCVTSYFYKED